MKRRKMQPIKSFGVKPHQYLNEAVQTDLAEQYLKTIYAQNPPVPNRLKSSRAIGIEVEIENVGHAPDYLYPLWTEVREPSLRNGIEIVSIPLVGDNVLYALGVLQRFYAAYPASKFNHLCSIHVHVNVLDMYVEQITALTAAYIAFEGLFFEKVVPFRGASPYCFRLGDVDWTKDKLWMDATDRAKCKYYALNLGPIYEYGTIEFRHHQGTKSIVDLMSWLDFLTQFVDYFAATDPVLVQNILEELNTSSHYDKFASDIWTPNHINNHNLLSLHQLMRNNIIQAKKVFL